MKRVCPSCNSRNVVLHRRGESLVNGLAGYSILGPIGLLAASVGADDVISICDCGHSFSVKPEPPITKSLGRQFREFLVALALFVLFIWAALSAPTIFK